MYFLEQDINKMNTQNNKINIFSRIYPIEVKEINQGIITGKNKIISMKDLTVSKKNYKKYRYSFFDENGYLIKNKIQKLTTKNKDIIIHLEKNEILIAEKINDNK